MSALSGDDLVVYHTDIRDEPLWGRVGQKFGDEHDE